MSFAVGQRIAHYTIRGKLGEGGMGVVYKAHDGHLDRIVALKVLRHDRVADSARRQRFIREAKTASSLNHRHIVTIHDIDTAAAVTFIAMEYVAGKTLEQTIRGGRMPVRDWLKYAIQIADALTAAHAAGIVHRDIKPANVIIAESDDVRVLDFGLAKLTDVPESDEHDTTRTLRADTTEPGIMIGTVAYMSPEQAEGKKVDARSDIFSFGSLLYEMCTGHRAFSGETRASTLAAVLREEPRPAASVDAEIPREVEKIIQRCLRKDPNRRYQHMADVKLALEEVKEEVESGTVVLVSARRRRFAGPAILVTLVVLVIAAALLWTLKRKPAPIQPVLTRLTSDSGWTSRPALSPDGKLVAYASDRGSDHLNIWVRQIAGGDSIQITHEDGGASEPFFSPDSSKIVFRSERDGGGVYVVSALGGEASVVAKGGRAPRFSPDGAWIVFGPPCAGMREEYIQVVPTAGGEPRRLGADLNFACHPVWSPDSRSVLALGSKGPPELDTVEWWILALDSSMSRRIEGFALSRSKEMEDAIAANAWLDGFVYFCAGSAGSRNLWRIALDSNRSRVDGEAERLTFGTATESTPSPALSTNGVRVVFASESSNYDIWSLPVDANRGRVVGEIQRITDGPSADVRPTVSADGRKIVFRSDRTGTGEIWIRNLVTGKETMLSSGPGYKHHALLSLDGSTVVYAVAAEPRPCYSVPSTGGKPEKIAEECYVVENFTPDGKSVTFGSPTQDGKHLFGIFLLDLASKRRTAILSHPKWDLWGQTFSSDGRWIAFHATESSEGRGVHLAPFRADGRAPIETWIAVAGPPAEQARWSPDGNLLYYLSKRDGFQCLWAQRLDPQTKRPVKSEFPVYHSHLVRRSIGNVPGDIVAPAVIEGKIFLTQNERTSNLWMVELPARH